MRVQWDYKIVEGFLLKEAHYFGSGEVYGVVKHDYVKHFVVWNDSNKAFEDHPVRDCKPEPILHYLYNHENGYVTYVFKDGTRETVDENGKIVEGYKDPDMQTFRYGAPV